MNETYIVKQPSILKRNMPRDMLPLCFSTGVCVTVGNHQPHFRGGHGISIAYRLSLPQERQGFLREVHLLPATCAPPLNDSGSWSKANSLLQQSKNEKWPLRRALPSHFSNVVNVSSFIYLFIWVVNRIKPCCSSKTVTQRRGTNPGSQGLDAPAILLSAGN